MLEQVYLNFYRGAVAAAESGEWWVRARKIDMEKIYNARYITKENANGNNKKKETQCKIKYKIHRGEM